MKWSLKEIQQHSGSWQHLLDSCRTKTQLLKETVTTAPLAEAISLWQDISKQLRELTSWGLCLTAENVQSKEGIELSSLSLELQADFEQASTLLDARLVKEGETPLEYPLALRRLIASKKMDTRQENLYEDLAPFGFHAWYEMYKTVIGNLKVTVREKVYSLGQLDNLFSHPDRSMRKEAFTALHAILQKNELLFANILRAILGFRLCLYKNRKWDNPFQEALWNNRMDQKTLEALWHVVDEYAPVFQGFCEQKASLLSLEQLSWFDLEAPLYEKTKEYSYEDACSYIVTTLSQVCPDLADFCKKAIDAHWIEAEDRPGKAGGGFCTPFPLVKESRVFMTFSGTMHNVLVLAHELGHAFHSHVLFDDQEINQLYPMSLAETASTTAELLLLDGLYSSCKTKEERLAIIYEKVQRSVTFFLNIRARFLFEERLFLKAGKGFLSADDFSKIMAESQNKAYGDILEVYHPYFWISKLHFYLTDLPCYNFPYTAGYLLALAIFAKAKKEPSSFNTWYRAFLQDTGKLSFEDVIQKHFGMDPREKDFWQEAIAVAIKDVELFYTLLEQNL